MAGTIVEGLANFIQESRFETLPADVVKESKRLLLDSFGCALAGHKNLKGIAGREFSLQFGTADEASIIGTNRRSSVLAAAFANAELVNALDMDAVLPAGHVTPYSLPPALAVAENRRASGKDLILAIALGHGFPTASVKAWGQS